MKTSPIISLSLLLFFFTSRVNAQDKPGTGICFFEGSYAALLQEAQRQQRSVVIATHLRREAALADRLLCMQGGCLLTDARRGTPEFATALNALRQD